MSKDEAAVRCPNCGGTDRVIRDQSWAMDWRCLWCGTWFAEEFAEAMRDQPPMMKGAIGDR